MDEDDDVEMGDDTAASAVQNAVHGHQAGGTTALPIATWSADLAIHTEPGLKRKFGRISVALKDPPMATGVQKKPRVQEDGTPKP